MAGDQSWLHAGGLGTEAGSEQHACGNGASGCENRAFPASLVKWERNGSELQLVATEAISVKWLRENYWVGCGGWI
jgi:hypothetical protein